MKLSAVIIGNYGATNLGDEAILQSILSSHPEINFTVFSNNPESTSATYNVVSTYPLPFGIHSIIRGNTTQSLEALHKADFIIIGGGGLFTDEKIKAVLLWGWHFFWAKHYKKPVFFYANSIGPLKSKLGKFITKKVLQKADYITVRDEESANILKEFKITNFEITSDPAFLIPAPKQNIQKNKKIAISLRNWIKHEENYVNVLKETVNNLEEKGYQILLISMQNFQDDDRLILEKISSEKSLIISPRNFSELISILNECEFTLGMRLHFLIASALAKTPFATLSYSQKTDSLAKKLEMEKYLLAISNINLEKTTQVIDKLIEKKETIKNTLTQKDKNEIEKAKKNIKIFENFIAK